MKATIQWKLLLKKKKKGSIKDSFFFLIANLVSDIPIL